MGSEVAEHSAQNHFSHEIPALGHPYREDFVIQPRDEDSDRMRVRGSIFSLRILSPGLIRHQAVALMVRFCCIGC